MAKARRTREKTAPLTMEQWRANLRERFRPAVVELFTVFDEMLRRSDEDEWRAALVEELLDLLEAGVDGGSADAQADMETIEARLIATVLAVQARPPAVSGGYRARARCMPRAVMVA